MRTQDLMHTKWRPLLVQADRVELLALTNRQSFPVADWPDHLDKHISHRQLLLDAEALQVIELFQKLESGPLARCHMPPWAISFYSSETLLFTATICFWCDNAYIYTAEGRGFRTFYRHGENAQALYGILSERLKVEEDLGKEPR